MTPEQFEGMLDRQEERRTQNLREILSALVPSVQDRERLIKIEGKIETAILLGQANRASDLEKIKTAEAKADAAHRRADGILRWVITSVLATVGGMLLTALFVYSKMTV